MRQARPGAAPERMIRLSACRRMRVVRWSRRNRSLSSFGSSERRSMRSRRLSWRWTRIWLRRARLTKTPEMPPASSARSTAARSAARCTVSRASATCPASSSAGGPCGASASTSTSSPARSLRMASGSLRRAISRAPSRRPTNSTTRPRPMRTEMTSEAATARRPRSTAAPAGVSTPRVNGSARSATCRPASSSIARMPSRTRACASSQRVTGAADPGAGPPESGASTSSSAARTVAWAPSAARSRHAARSEPRRSATADSVRVRRLSTAPVNSRSRSPARPSARGTPASRASSWASASPARANSTRTRASDPRSASWTPLSAPPTGKAAAIAAVYRPYASFQSASPARTAVRSGPSPSAPVTNVSSRRATPVGSSPLSATVWRSPRRSSATARSVRAVSSR